MYATKRRKKNNTTSDLSIVGLPHKNVSIVYKKYSKKRPYGKKYVTKKNIVQNVCTLLEWKQQNKNAVYVAFFYRHTQQILLNYRKKTPQNKKNVQQLCTQPDVTKMLCQTFLLLV
eukprot:GEMP01078042.1.p1 GENE.GEMP01078042.1~~GEMP01078042.1.p1  ORF type:complete len:116 (-),score=7.63 GEMP01078042.1:168-515(-)